MCESLLFCCIVVLRKEKERDASQESDKKKYSYLSGCTGIEAMSMLIRSPVGGQRLHLHKLALSSID